ncbi:zinc finger BED domain-containing protein RICESLEEPER 2-like [Nymphaea colorata]|uniref:zinc finger BED domain-containing protein RICESLEEPER 2-like n=1 Tax=Nymphaea colorata TaxID=210225 RepID=UPI00129DD00F|nr:zinc finger BED domain-containing protein RICESLEEPER 2-like [Nymphaea colorata]
MVKDGLSAIKNEIISITDAVKYIKVSPSRLHGFAAAGRELDLSTTKKLVLDVPTRWNSTYFMLETALAYKDAFARYSMEDPGFVWLLVPKDWEKIAVICDFLHVFYDVSTLFSGSSYATANLYFLEIWRVQEILQEKVENEGGFMKAMAVKMKEKFDKYWKSCNLLMVIASILDPRVKLTLSEFVFSRIYQSREEREEQMQMIKQSLQDVYESYIQRNEVDVNISTASTTSSSIQGRESQDTPHGGRKLFFKFLGKAENVVFQVTKSEIDTYLEDGLIKHDDNGDEDSFNILQWWKDKESKYRILSQMARDLLSIPITSAASEKAFSTGGRIVNDSRSSLMPKTVKALVCLGNWVKNDGDPMHEVLTKVSMF